MILKPAQHGHEIPWHQDEAYWDPGMGYHAVGAWMPLDDVDVEQRLHVLPARLAPRRSAPASPHRQRPDRPRPRDRRPSTRRRWSRSRSPPAGRRSTTPARSTTRGRTRATATAAPSPTSSRPHPRRARSSDHRPWIDEGRKAWAPASPALMIDPTITNPALIDTDARQPGGHVREPDRRPRRRRHAHGGRKGAPEPHDRRRRAGRPRRPRGPGHRPPPLDDRPAGAARADAVAAARGLLRRPRRAEHLGARARLLRRCPTAVRSRTTRRSSRCKRGAGFNTYLPMPFRERMRIELHQRAATGDTTLYYQVDYTLSRRCPTTLGYLHVAFRRENPTDHEARTS